MNNLTYLLPRDTYDRFIMGICMESNKVIYDANKIMVYDIIPQLKLLGDSDDYLEADALDDFHFNFLFEDSTSKFIYCHKTPEQMMTLEQAHTITNLAKHMLVRASEDFEPTEFIESVKLFNEIVKELTHANLDNDTVKYNNMGDKS